MWSNCGNGVWTSLGLLMIVLFFVYVWCSALTYLYKYFFFKQNAMVKKKMYVLKIVFVWGVKTICIDLF